MELGSLPDGGLVQATDQFVVSRGGAARRISGARLVLTDASGQTALGSDPRMAASARLRAADKLVLSADAAATTLYAGSSTFAIRNATDDATLLSLSNAGALAINGTFNATGAISQNGNAVWHAGNFTPSNYMPTSGGVFSGGISAPAITLGNPNDTPTFFNIVSAGVSRAYFATDTLGTYLNSNRGPINFQFQGNTAAAISAAGALNTAGAITQAGNQVWHAGNFSPSNYAALSGAAFTGGVSITGNDAAITLAGATASGFYAGMDMRRSGSSVNASVRMIAQDNNDYGSVQVFTRGGDGFVERMRVRYDGNVGIGTQSPTERLTVSGTLSATGAITQAGNQVWHAGNFSPSSYAALSGATFTGNVGFGVTPTSPIDVKVSNGARFHVGSGISFTGPRLYAGNAADSAFSPLEIQSDQLYFFNQASTLLATLTNGGALNTIGAITQAGNQVWHAGNFSPSSYAVLTGATFTGGISAPTVTGGVSNHYLGVSGGSPLHVFDADDYVAYDRASNIFAFYIGGVLQMTLSATGLRVRGTITGNLAGAI